MDLVRTFKALSDPTRLRILAAVAEDEFDGRRGPRGRGLGPVRGVAQSGDPPGGGFRARPAGGHERLFLAPPRHGGPGEKLFDSAAAGLCRSAESRRGRRRLDRCRQKRTRRSRGYFEAIAGDWERIRQSCFDDRLSSLALEKLLPANLVLADIGCGTGSLTRELARFAKKVIGVDLSPEMLRRANLLAREGEISNVEFRRGDAEKLPLARQSVDAAFCVMVLHFLEQPERALRELCRVTRRAARSCSWTSCRTRRSGCRRRWRTVGWASIDPRSKKWFRAAGCTEVDFELTGSYAGEGQAQRQAPGRDFRRASEQCQKRQIGARFIAPVDNRAKWKTPSTA